MGPIQQRAGSDVRNIVLSDASDMRVTVGLWGKLATQFSDEHIQTISHTKVIVIVCACKVVRYQGVPALQTTSASLLYLNIPLKDINNLNAVVAAPILFAKEEEKTEEELPLITIQDVYKELQDSAVLGRRFAVIGTIIDVDTKDWKYVPCKGCKRKANLCEGRFFCFHCNKQIENPREGFKLVIKLAACQDTLTCVLLDESVLLLLHITVEKLVLASISEGGNASMD